MNFDTVKFRNALIEAASEALIEVRRSFGEEDLYGFVLMLDGLGSVVSAAGQSEQALEQSAVLNARYWKCETGNLNLLISKMHRWDCAEWTIVERPFEKANSLLDSVDYERLYDYGVSRLVYLSCLATLAELDANGVFGRGRERKSIVLNLFIGDQSDSDLLTWAKMVNPHEVFVRYKGEIHEARAVYEKLVYTGPV